MSGRAIVTRNALEVAAPLEVIFDLAVDVLRWPHNLPHYRYVRRLDTSCGRSTRRTFAMGATRGMDVAWRFRCTEGGVEVTIDHWLEPRRWWLRNPLARYVMGRLFVEHIADRTLRGIGAHAENLASRGREP